MKSFFTQYFGGLKSLRTTDIKSLVSKKVSQDYADLELIVKQNAFRTRIEDTLSSPKSWKWILAFFISVSTLLLGGGIFFTYLHQNYDIWWFYWQPISLDTAQNLIDQRISNVATIIGLSLTVSTFLINNLAEKESNYHLLFKTVFIYPIIYYALGLMIWLETISILKESFSAYNSYLFVNAVAFTHFLIALLLLSIAYLFSQLIPLLNPEFLHQKTIEDFTKNAHIILLDEIKVKEKERAKKKVFGKDYIRPEYAYMLVKPKSKYIGNYDSYNKTIERQTEKIKTAIEKGDLKALQKGLEFYKIGYEVFCTYMKSNNLFRYRFDDPSIIKQKQYLLSEILRLSIEQKKFQPFDEILYFLSSYLTRSRYSDSQIVFYQLIGVIESTFKYIKPQSQSYSLTEILELIDRTLPLRSYTSIKPEVDSIYYLECYTLLLILIQATLKHLYDSAETKSLESFQAAMKVLNDANEDLHHEHFRTEHNLWELSNNTTLSKSEREQVKKELREKMRLYDASRHASLAVKSWLFYIYSIGFIDAQLLKNAIGSVNYQFDDSKTLLADYCTILKAGRDYLGFDDWSFREPKYSSRISISPATSPNDWLPYGLLFEILRYDLDENIDYSAIETNIKWQYGDAEWPFNLMADKQEEWLEILGIDAKIYAKRKVTFRNIIERLARQQKLKEQQDIASKTFEVSKVDSFKEENFKSWTHHASILSVFEHFGNKIVRPITDSSLVYYPFSTDYLKSAFVEQNYSVFMERGNYGGGVGDYFNTSFLELIYKEKNDQILSYPTVAEAYAGVSKLLIDKGFKPNLIIAPIDFIYRYPQFDAIPSFEKIYGDSKKLVHHSGMIGNDVFVVTHYSKDWEDKIIVCDFDKAFQLLMGEDVSRMDNQIEINVRESTEDEFQKAITQYYNNWSENEKLSREETIAKIKNRVVVEMNYNLKLEVIDKEAFEIIEIGQDLSFSQ